ncbi:hypothetical protein [Deinococcus yunweiensis]|uniref:hypothetical protein n=1 Tax=Deinococcus yunweiensis TaxID=367282 RepID=UPI00398F1E65
MATLNRTGLSRLRRERLTPLAVAGAQAAAGVLREKLSGEGSGRKYPGLPNRSSSQTEYPAEQSGALRDSISARADGDGRAVFGPIIDPPVEAGYLHFSTQADIARLHFRPPADGGRPFMDDALEDRDLHQAVREAMGVKR